MNTPRARPGLLYRSLTKLFTMLGPHGTVFYGMLILCIFIVEAQRWYTLHGRVASIDGSAFGQSAGAVRVYLNCSEQDPMNGSCLSGAVVVWGKGTFQRACVSSYHVSKGRVYLDASEAPCAKIFERGFPVAPFRIPHQEPILWVGKWNSPPIWGTPELGTSKTPSEAPR